MWEVAIGLLASVAGIVSWWLNNRAKTKEEAKKDEAAELHKITSDAIDSELD